MAEDEKRSESQIDANGKLRVNEKPGDATGINVEGKTPTFPSDGFGQLWRKTYKVRLTGIAVAPEEVVARWKERLPDFMPDHSRFYPSLGGIEAGQVVLIDATMPGGVPVSTGVLVLHSDPTRFTLVTPQGHPESGYNSFSAHHDGKETVAQIQSVARAADPLYEFGYRFMGGMKHQESIWRHVLTALARHFGASRPQVEMQREKLDGHVQWSKALNVWHNALIRTTVSAPVRVAGKLIGRRE
ncbi:MAG: DUF1990 family protein [Anaerolineae bacterium]|jgi:hypothetical protein|nr:DUF1990 family protein [Anaerolineae bacterium]